MATTHVTGQNNGASKNSAPSCSAGRSTGRSSHLRWSRRVSCRATLGAMQPPVMAKHRDVWRNFTVSFTEPQQHVRHRVWVLIPFGFEIQMLKLHAQTLQNDVDGILVVESAADIAQGASKPLHLSEALRRGTFLPRNVSRLLHVRVLSVEPHPVSSQAHRTKDAVDTVVDLVHSRALSGRLSPRVDRRRAAVQSTSTATLSTSASKHINVTKRYSFCWTWPRQRTWRW